MEGRRCPEQFYVFPMVLSHSASTADVRPRVVFVCIAASNISKSAKRVVLTFAVSLRHYHAQMHWQLLEGQCRSVDFGAQLRPVFVTLSDRLGFRPGHQRELEFRPLGVSEWCAGPHTRSMPRVWNRRSSDSRFGMFDQRESGMLTFFESACIKGFVRRK